MSVLITRSFETDRIFFHSHTKKTENSRKKSVRNPKVKKKVLRKFSLKSEMSIYTSMPPVVDCHSMVDSDSYSYHTNGNYYEQLYPADSQNSGR